MRFAATTVCAALCASLISTPLAADFELDQFEASRDIIENPGQYVSPDMADRLREPGDDETLKTVAKEIADETHQRVDEDLQRLKFDEQNWVFERDETAEVEPGAGLGKNMKTQSALGKDGEVRYVVYLSLGMPDQEFTEAMKAIKSRDDAFGVIIGLAEKDHTIPDTMKLLYQRWNDHDPDSEVPPLIYMDPNLFTDYSVKRVPTVIRFDGRKPTLKVHGMLNIDWVEDQFEAGRTGELGQQGPTYEIAEEPFMETVKRRMAKLDPDKMKRQAMDRFWSKQNFTKLPTAEKTASFQVDLTFTVKEDLQTPSGTYLARKGQQINPLDTMPFQRIGIVFDAKDPEQVAWAQEEVKRAKRKKTLPIVMITDLDISEDGWEEFRALNDSIPGIAVKMANAAILDRFEVEKVPSRFEQDGKFIRVTEFSEEDIK